MDATVAAEPLTADPPLAEPLIIDDPETIRLVHEYAGQIGVGPVEAIKRALSEALERDRREVEARRTRVRALLDEMAAWPNVGPPADKAFYDSLNDEEDDEAACS